MKEVEKRVLDSAVRMLISLGLEYAIALPDGQVLGTYAATKTRRPKKYPHGSITSHIRPYLANAQRGDIIVIPEGDYDLNTIQSTVCTYLGNVFGAGSYKTARANDALEILIFKS